MKYLGLVLLTVACSQPRTPEQEARRQVCLADADDASDRRVDVECKGFTWEDCPSRLEIMDELKKEQRKCR